MVHSTFRNCKSAIWSNNYLCFVFSKLVWSLQVQVDPYLEDALCSSCGLRQGPYFCRDLNCFKYFCRTCWDIQHAIELLNHHQPLMRNSRPSSNQNLNKSYGGLPEFFGGNMRSHQTRFDSNYEWFFASKAKTKRELKKLIQEYSLNYVTKQFILFASTYYLNNDPHEHK